jgi:Tol biopolymer transport system component
VVQVEGLSADDRYGPALSLDGQWLYLSLVPAGGTEDLYRARRGASGAEFTDLEPVPNLNGPSLEGSPFLSSDGLSLYFFSDRSGGEGSRDLWLATRASTSSEFTDPAPVPGVNSSEMDLLPRLSADGSTLWFESTRAGGSGSSDIWEAVRSSPAAPFGTPRPRADLNTGAREEGITLSADQLTLILASTRGTGDLDLLMATRARASAAFGVLQPLGELNSAADDLDPFLSASGREIYFVSTRAGDYRIYYASRDCL